MKKFYWLFVITIFIVNLSITGCQKEKKVVFSCEQDNQGEWVTTIKIGGRKDVLILWRRTNFISGSLIEKIRCQQVTPRLQNAYDNNNLQFLTWGFMGNQKVLCTTTEKGKGCHTLILTLLESDDPEIELKKFISVLNGEKSGYYQNSSCAINKGGNITCAINFDHIFSMLNNQRPPNYGYSDNTSDLIPWGLILTSGVGTSIFLAKKILDKKNIQLETTQPYYTDISCPRRIWAETTRISVVVRLRIKPPKYSDAPVQELSVNTELPVRVRIDAPAFNILSDAEQEITVQPNTDSIPLVFDLQPKPENIGHTHINFDFFQTGNPIGNTASVPVEITAYETNNIQSEPISGILKRSSRRVPPPDLKLYIKYERFHNQPVLYFTLFRCDSVGYELPPIPIEGDPKTYATNLYKKLGTSTDKTAINSRMIAETNQMRFGNDNEILEQTDRTIKNIGFKLWEELIPSELKTIYLENRETWNQQKLLLVSDEPYIPWELVWPYDENEGWEDDVPWCMSLQMTRWLRRNAEGKGHEVAPTEIYLKKLACIAPHDAKLEYALQERKFLNEQLAKYKIDDVSPHYSSISAVRKLLEEAEYNWLHIASHGLYFDDIPDDASEIILENGDKFTLDDILGAKVKGHINKKRPGFVFNACHSGRQAWALTGLGGWPNRLISSGAGLFVAPLWKVRDDLALKFAQTFYQELFNGKTVAEAVYSSRLAAKTAGDSTWLAYSVYAHPNATIICGECDDWN